MGWSLDPHGWTVDTILLFWLYSIVLILLFVPVAFILLNHIAYRNHNRLWSLFTRTVSHILVHQRLMTTVTILGVLLLSLSILYHGSYAYVISSVEKIFMRFGYSALIPDDIDEFSLMITILTTQLLLPISTLLIILTWHLATSTRRIIFLFLGIAVWFVFRIGLTVVFLVEPELNLQDGIEKQAVFGSFAGLWICCVLSFGSAAISGFVLQNASYTLRVLVIMACLAPLLVLIWFTFDISVRWLTIDYFISALVLGWLLSEFNRSSRIGGDCNRSDNIGGPTPVVVGDTMNHSDWKRRIRVFTDNHSWISSMIRVCLFMVLVIVPAILLKVAFHSVFGFRLDGSAAAWAMIWSVALSLGCFAFFIARLYELRGRALQLGTVAFLCTFAIMIFNWNAEFDPMLMGHQNQFSVVFSMPIVALAIPILIATVVVGKHHWTWPFWTCWVFIYIWNHAIAGSSYIKDLSNLDLFSWINMSLIVFVFLFAIPIYFASDLRRKLDMQTFNRRRSKVPQTSVAGLDFSATPASRCR